jgi:hypothetical protein
MATSTFPSYAKLLLNGYQQQRESALLRTEMESGPPRQAKIRSRVMLTRTVNIYLSTLANFQAFESWYANDLKLGSAWFNFPDPVSGATVQARFVGGGYTATPMAGGVSAWQVQAKIESWG